MDAGEADGFPRFVHLVQEQFQAPYVLIQDIVLVQLENVVVMQEWVAAVDVQLSGEGGSGM